MTATKNDSKYSASSSETVEKKSKGTNKSAKSHLTSSEMVVEAIKNLNERKGSSLQAIKKYMASNYKFDVDKHGYLIKRAIKTAVKNQILDQVTGNGASGRFKLHKLLRVYAGKKPVNAVNSIDVQKKEKVTKVV